MTQHRLISHLAGWALAACPLALWAQSVQTSDREDWNAKFQATYVRQDQHAFPADYSGAHSLSPQKAYSYSFTTTLALGYRPWQGGELYLNPEAAQGVPLSGLTGLGGFTNGEMARSSGAQIKLYRARLFLRQTWGDGGEQDAVDSAANQLAGKVDRRRWVLTAGNLSITDIFDGNAYSHDARTQFLNWALMTHGAYDYAGDARGYTSGIALERYLDDWVIRAGRFAVPKLPNQQALDARMFKYFGDQIELEHAHQLGEWPGKVRLLAFRNRAKMSRFQDALNLAAAEQTTPDINQVRDAAHVKHGLGVNLEQALGEDAGLFLRQSWADGGTETYAFTEIDRSVSGGVTLKGRAWGREKDTVGLGFAQNRLSGSHRRYLAAGGQGFFLGDGALNYRPEGIVEVYYSANVCPSLRAGTWVTLDLQSIRNPAYNADRGPVRVGSLRLHTEF